MSALTDRIEADVSGIFMDTSAFAVEASYTFGSLSKTVAGLFEENYRPVDQFGNEIGATGPAFLAARGDVVNEDGELPDSSATLVISEVTYHVTKAMDSDGTAVLMLSRDEAALDA